MPNTKKQRKPIESRRPKTYADFQIFGMRATAKWVRALRQSQPDIATPSPNGHPYRTTRGWTWWMHQQTGRLFNLGDITRYEHSGRINTQGQINIVSDEYLFSISQMVDLVGKPIQPYTEKDMICLYNGCLDPLSPSIEDYTAIAKRKLGDKKLFEAVKKAGLSQQDFFESRRGLLFGDRHQKMAQILDMPVSKTLEAGRVQLYQDAIREHCNLAMLAKVNKDFTINLKKELPEQDLEHLLDDAQIDDPFIRERITSTFEGSRAALDDIFILAAFMRYHTEDKKWDATYIASLMLLELESIDVASSARV